MPDWGTFVTGSITGGAAGLVLGGLTSNVSHELLEEWRQTRQDKRDQQRERRAELRAIREAKRNRLFPALDQAFDAAETIRMEAARLLDLAGEEEAGGRHVAVRRQEFYAPDMTTAMRRLAAAVLAIRHEESVPELVQGYTLVRQVYDAFDRVSDAAARTPNGWQEHAPDLQLLLRDLLDRLQPLQTAVLACREALEEPI